MFAGEGMPGPDFAPDCPLLFSDPAGAHRFEKGRSAIAVALFERKLIYCDSRDWPLMDVERLKYVAVDCLVDPATGDALMIEPQLCAPILNRQQKRDYAARRARGWRASKGKRANGAA